MVTCAVVSGSFNPCPDTPTRLVTASWPPLCNWAGFQWFRSGLEQAGYFGEAFMC